MKKPLILLLLFTQWCLAPARAQYAPQVGIAGTTAIYKTDAQISGWATGCTIQRGFMNIANPSIGYASIGDSTSGIGPSDGNVVSLGDSGIAILTFATPIYDAPGADFAVFENGFTNPANTEEAFLELAFVEVSSDGINYFRFPAHSLMQDTVQDVAPNDYMNARSVDNLAGKYIAGYGTPFDLSRLANQPGLDIQHITHVRLIDVIGDIGTHATTDSAGNKINDPYPTPYASSGFDLDAVAAIHQYGTGITTIAGNNKDISVFPNPATSRLTIQLAATTTGRIALRNTAGTIMYQSANAKSVIDIQQWPRGIYYLTFYNSNGWQQTEKVVLF